jgi:hypothetical protein
MILGSRGWDADFGIDTLSVASNLIFDIAKIVDLIVPPFGGQRAEGAPKIAVAAGFQIIDRTVPGEQIKAWPHVIRCRVLTERLAHNREQCFPRLSNPSFLLEVEAVAVLPPKA